MNVGTRERGPTEVAEPLDRVKRRFPLVDGRERRATARRGVQGLAPAKGHVTLASCGTELLLDAADHPGLK